MLSAYAKNMQINLDLSVPKNMNVMIQKLLISNENQIENECKKDSNVANAKNKISPTTTNKHRNDEKKNKLIKRLNANAK